MKITQHEWAILAFNLLYLGIAAALAARTGNTEFIFYVVVLALLFTGIGALHMRVRFPMAALWALSAWGVAHMAGGMMPISDEVGVLYNLWLIPHLLKYDQLVHAYGFGISTWICWLALRMALVNPRPTFGILTLLLLAGMGLGALNELVEFAATKLVPNTNVGGYDNTGWDLAFNFFGALIAVIAIRLASGDSNVDKTRAPLG